MKTEIIVKAKAKYKIIKRRVAGKNRFMAKLIYNRDLGTAEFLEGLNTLGTSVTLTDLKAAVALINEGIQIELNKANRVALPWGVYYPAIRGGMLGMKDVFTSGRHRLVARITVPKKYSLGLAAKLAPVRVRVNLRKPELESILDSIYQVHNQVLTSGSIATLRGDDLKFDWQDENQGIFLVDSEGTSVRVEFYSNVNETSVQFVVPPLKAGERYQVLLKVFDSVSGEKIEKPLEEFLLTANVEPDPDWDAKNASLPVGEDVVVDDVVRQDGDVDSVVDDVDVGDDEIADEQDDQSDST